jgi:CO/xanthine dehydrogenase Mo-binding subunit
MGIEGIGARVARKEDRRFITGAGRYVDDMVVPGMKHAAFVRSPHAHAKIKGIDVGAAQDMPGVIAVLTGRELQADGIGNLDLRLDDPFQGRFAHEYGGLVAAGYGDGALCWRCGGDRGGRDQGPGARRGRSGCRRL